ncbi:hypothetical protein K2173_010646 [Erythroxylum novogranatense]|uniref:Uncharacterized protein n=1 Tax=Erythroxylum novogranatense TaxID=1862640 RepID=A0AAV8TFX2_9ROSI|nr:hypothetical protein K2173_010646 [Erythroxylum novogranatense]
MNVCWTRRNLFVNQNRLPKMFILKKINITREEISTCGFKWYLDCTDLWKSILSNTSYLFHPPAHKSDRRRSEVGCFVNVVSCINWTYLSSDDSSVESLPLVIRWL